MPTLGIVAFAVGGAGLAFGVVSGLIATSKHSTLSGECDSNSGTCPASAQSDVDSFHSWRVISTVGYVVGAVGVAAGVVLWLTAPKAAPRGTGSVGVMVGPASACLAGTFR
jgi:hypothetical protein